VAALDSTFGGFRQRAEQTYALLQAPGTAFLVVAAPEPDALREATFFVERLAEDGMPLAGLVVNRVHDSSAATLSAERSLGAAEQLDELGGHPVAAGLLRVHAERMQQVAREEHLLHTFTSAFPTVPVARAAALPSDVHDLDGLRAVAASLVAP
jgi:anion-transporting  ArsA/GET3 family ATPase